MLQRSTLALLLAAGIVSALGIKGHDAHWSSPDSTESLTGVTEGDDAAASSSVHAHRPRGTASGLLGLRPAKTSGRHIQQPRGMASGLHVYRPVKTGGVHVQEPARTSSAVSPLQSTAASVGGMSLEGGDDEEFEDVPIGAQVLTNAGSPADRHTSEASKQSQPKCLDSQRGSAGHDGIIIMIDLSNVKDVENVGKLFAGLKSCSWSQKIPKYMLYNDHARHQDTLNSFMERFDVRAIDMDKPLGELHIWSHPQEYSESTKFHDKYGLGYRMMCEAWGIKMPEVARRLGLKYFMRLDSDSKMTCDADRQQSPFDVMRSKCLKYGYYNLSRDFWFWTQGFRDFLIGYASTHKKNFLPGAMESMASLYAEPDKIVSKRAAGLPDEGKEIWLGRKMFYNNFEILQVDHFLQDSVKDFTAAVAKSHGIYKHRWGDAVIRYYQVAFFAKPEEVGCFDSDEFHYSHANTLNKGRNREGTCTRQIV